MTATVIRAGERTLTPQAFERRAASAARGLRELGIGRGDAVALVLRNDVALLEAASASRLAGATVVPVNWHFTHHETRYVLTDCGARMVVVHADLLPAIAPGIPSGVAVRVVRTPPEIARAYGIEAGCCAVTPEHVDWDRWLEAHAPIEVPASPPGNTMLYTSGTTGNPKGVRREPLDAAGSERYLRSLAGAFGLRAGMRHLITGPLYHSSPFANAQVALWVGGELDLMARFDPLGLLRRIETDRVTHMHLVPTMFVRLLRLPEPERGRFDLSSLECVSHGAAPCPVAVKRAMIEWWGPIIREYYGSTEASVLTAVDSAEWLQRPGTVGRARPGVELAIRDEDGNDLPPGRVGEVWGRLDCAPPFDYHGRAEERRAIERDGLLTNGDMGFLDADGYLYLCDRKRDMIISGGVNIYPAEVEAVLLEHRSVVDCAVFGIPDPEFGEAVAAAVQIDRTHPVDAGALGEHLRERLARYKVPRVFEFHDALPRLDNGKIYKQRLREPHWAGSGRLI